MNSTNTRLTALLGACSLGLLLAPPTQAASSSAGDEFLSNAEAAPPNILFVLDLSDEMLQDCGEVPDAGDTGDTAGTLAGASCLEYGIDAIEQLTLHYDWAYFGVVGTSGSSSDTFTPIAPIGSTAAEISSALSHFSSVAGTGGGGTASTSWGASATVGTEHRNLGEVLGESWDYLSRDGSSGSCPGRFQDSFVDSSTDF